MIHKIKPQWLILLAILTLVMSGVKLANQTPKNTPLSTKTTVNIDTPFPLKKGSYWVYEGVAKWTKNNTNQVNEKTLTWKMEVLDTIQRGHITVAILKGHTADLAWYQEGKEPGDYLIVQVNTDKFYLVSGERTQQVLQRVRDEGDFLANLLEEWELFLEWPLMPGKVFGPSSQISRQDGGYRWNVEDRQQVGLNVQGTSLWDKKTQYRLSFRTAADYSIVNFMPGVGITRYRYLHHGTVAASDFKLIEYHQPNE